VERKNPSGDAEKDFDDNTFEILCPDVVFDTPSKN
jgi:hypothetical protein